MVMDRNTIDVASGGALMDKTPAVLTELTLVVRQLAIEQHQPSAPETDTTISTIVATTGSATRQFTFDGRVDEIPAKIKCHDLRSKNTGGTTRQHSESAAVGWFQKSSISNNSKFKRGRECHITVKW
ncbi:hypothetical protein CR513_32809, partial [Mucuna pruriens]